LDSMTTRWESQLENAMPFVYFKKFNSE